MAVAQFYAWDRAGRPLEPARPIREVVERLRLAFPKGEEESLFSWYANDEHYESDWPQDHTPFSVTGWPSASPYPVVFATDVMHRPDLGVDCHVLFPYWLAEARAGRMPWLKYIIWQAKIYDVRYDWKQQASSEHFTHIHLSARTDHRYTSLGSWSLVPGGDDMSADDVAAINKHTSDTVKRLAAFLTGGGENSLFDGSTNAWIRDPKTVTLNELAPERIAAAVVAQLPVGTPGGLTPEDVEQAVRDAFAHGLATEAL